LDPDPEAQDRFAALERRVQLLEDEVAVLRLVNSWGPVSANRWEFARTSSRWRVTRRTNRVIDGSPEAQQILVRALGRER
jgi:hypothetical protein